MEAVTAILPCCLHYLMIFGCQIFSLPTQNMPLITTSSNRVWTSENDLNVKYFRSSPSTYTQWQVVRIDATVNNTSLSNGLQIVSLWLANLSTRNGIIWIQNEWNIFWVESKGPASWYSNWNQTSQSSYARSFDWWLHKNLQNWAFYMY